MSRRGDDLFLFATRLGVVKSSIDVVSIAFVWPSNEDDLFDFIFVRSAAALLVELKPM